MARTVGIDLGTTNSVVAVMEGGEPVVIPSAEGGRTVPSVVGFKANGERLVGVTAKRQAVVNPENTVFSIKRFMGHKTGEVQEEIGRIPYKVKADKKGMAIAHIPALEKDFTPEEISAMILQKLKTDAEAYLGDTVSKAVITVPAYFNDAQRTATKNAGEIAGLEVLRIINEPTAASLAYGLDKKANETILVFDLGGGTFDVSILDVGEGVFEVKATAGDSHLGGDDFDQKIVEWLAVEFKKDQGVDLLKDRGALQRLREAAEKAKIELSSAVTAQIDIPYVTAIDNEPKHIATTLTRAKFEEMCGDLMQRIKNPFQRALEDAKLKTVEVDEVVLVGGATRMPMVQELVKKLTGKEPNRTVNPDEVVAVGAAIQGGILGGEFGKDIVLLDVTPLSMGVETQGGIYDKLIDRNTTIPTRKSRTYTTAADNQPEVEIHILQGERPLARDNKSLGRFHLQGILPAPARVPQIEVTFDIDANGILNVSAKDLGTGNLQKITITGSGNLNREEIDRMMKEAELNAEADKKAEESAKLRNDSEHLCYNTERSLKDLGDKVSEAERQSVTEKIAELRKQVTSGDDDAIREAFKLLEAESHQLAAKLYEHASAQQAEGSPDATYSDSDESSSGSASDTSDRSDSSDTSGDSGSPNGHGKPPKAGASSSKEDVIDAEFKEEK